MLQMVQMSKVKAFSHSKVVLQIVGPLSVSRRPSFGLVESKTGLLLLSCDVRVFIAG